MAAFTFTYPYPQQHPHFHLDSLFMSTNNFIINPVYFPSMPDSSPHQIDNVPQIVETNIEQSIMSDQTKQTAAADTPTTSSIVVDLEGDDQVINSQEKTNPSMVTKKRKNGSSLDSDINQSKKSKPKSKKQKKSDLELKEEKRIRDELKKKQKQERDELRAAVVPDYKTQADYVHVRARRGQANDSHSLAERVRREKISERLKMLQSLVPGCDKVNSKANMLDEIINYVQSLQVQVEMLSMKLAYMNPILYDFGVDLEDFYLQKPISTSTLAAATSSPSPPLPLTTTHQDSMTPAAPAVASTTAPTEFANVAVTSTTFSSTSNDTSSAIPVHEGSDSFSALHQEEVQQQQQKLNDFSQVLLQPEIPNSEEDLLCYMDYYQHHQRQEGATSLFYYE